MIILKSFGYLVVGVITFDFFLIIALGDVIYDKLTKIIKKNKYVDKTVSIAVNLFFIIILLFGFCSIGQVVCRSIGL